MNFSRTQILTVAVILLAALSIYLLATRGQNSGPTPGTESATSTQDSQDQVTSGDTANQNSSGGNTVAGQNNSISPLPNVSLSGKVAPELVRPGGFSNSDPFLLKDFIGKKIVLLQFWTTSSEETERTIPYLTDWYAKYKNYGLVIVAVHTPRFQFERSKTTVDSYALAHNMSYPLVIDNGAETWHAYRNNYWPHSYLIDMSGHIVYDKKGEGDYQTLEEKIKALLIDRANKLKGAALPESKLSVDSNLAVDITDQSQHPSIEGFFGSARNTNLSNGTAGKEGIQTFDSLAEPKLGMSEMFGSWKITGEYAESMTDHNSLIYRYHGKIAHGLMGTVKMMRVKVLLDGKPLDQTNAGKDIKFEKGDSVIYVGNPKLYQLVKDQAGYGDHTIELIPEAGGFDIYSLIFS